VSYDPPAPEATAAVEPPNLDDVVRLHAGVPTIFAVYWLGFWGVDPERDRR
jgi:hypothetical protein